MPELEAVEKFFGKKNEHPLKVSLEDNRPVPHILVEFWWDQIILLVTAVISIGTLVDTFLVQFLQDNTTAQCFLNNNVTYSMHQAQYINKYCQGTIPDIGRLFPIYLFSEIVLIAGAHYIWTLLNSSTIESFMTSLKQMDFTRDSFTGQFSRCDFDIAQRLETKFSQTYTRRCGWIKPMYHSYLFVKGFQVCVVIAFMVILSTKVQYDLNGDHTFQCNLTDSGVTDDGLKLIHCVFIPLQSFNVLRHLNTAACILIILSVVLGVALLLMKSMNAKKLCIREIAKFVVYSGIQPHYYCYKKYLGKNPLDASNLEFLMLKLNATDPIAGNTLKNILVEKHVHRLMENFCYCDIVKHKSLMRDIHDANNLTLRDIDFVAQTVRGANESKPFGIVMTYENDSLAYVIDCSKFEKVLGINFNPYAQKEVFTKHNNNHPKMPPILQLPSHVWSSDHSQEVHKEIEDEITRQFTVDAMKVHDLIIILGPLSEELYTDRDHILHLDHRVHQLLRCVHPGKRTFAVIVQPEKIGNETVSKMFCAHREINHDLHIPSCLKDVQLANDHNGNKKWMELPDPDPYMAQVPITVMNCTYEVSEYEYKSPQ